MMSEVAWPIAAIENKLNFEN